MYVQNILNMLHTLRFFSSKCRLFHNATFFGSCVIHILYTGCAKIKKKTGAKGLILYLLARSSGCMSRWTLWGRKPERNPKSRQICHHNKHLQYSAFRSSRTADEHIPFCLAVGLHIIRSLFITVSSLLIRIRQPSILIDSRVKLWLSILWNNQQMRQCAVKFISLQVHSTCFGRHTRPSSGVQF